ncbi:hypothetical protein [Novosphingobium sp. HII-3]|uniref:hypothetical protein n=1 Tax=Novosphingobium sp. HII-3 TaxID=2075565 RepID=UPI001E5B3039|nr:hypothetical protein [Novosphingobium sp. HII-3]
MLVSLGLFRCGDGWKQLPNALPLRHHLRTCRTASERVQALIQRIIRTGSWITHSLPGIGIIMT